jgi:ketosteroid isomerase-like protein
MSESDDELDRVIEAYRDALRAYVTGDPDPVLALWSQGDDATLANPFGPPCRGRAGIESATREAVSNFMEGGRLQFEDVTSRFDEVVRCRTRELGYVVQLERHEGTLVDLKKPGVVELRVTMIFRPEDDGWKVVHRQADAITAQRSPGS